MDASSAPEAEPTAVSEAVLVVLSDPDLVPHIAQTISPLAPVLRLVCRMWRAACAPHKTHWSSDFEWMAQEGLAGLLEWAGEVCCAVRRRRVAHNLAFKAAKHGQLECLRVVSAWSEPDSQYYLTAGPSSLPSDWEATVSDHGLAGAADGGHLACMQWVIERGARPTALAKAIIRAAAGGHTACAVLAYETFAATHGVSPEAWPPEAWPPEAVFPRPASFSLTFDAWQHVKRRAAAEASKQGHRALVTLVRSWGLEPEDEFAAFIAAAGGGQEECMRLIRAWSIEADEADEADQPALWPTQAWAHTNQKALASAAVGGHLGAMRLAHSWGALDLNQALTGAAEHGHEDCMSQLWEWGATDATGALAAAAANDHAGCMRLALGLGAVADGDHLALAIGNAECTELFLSRSSTITAGNCRVALQEAILNVESPVEVVRALCSYGTRTGLMSPADYENAFRSAASVGELDCMRVLREHGARDLGAALSCGVRDREPAAVRQLLEWGAASGPSALVAAAAAGCVDTLRVLDAAHGQAWDSVAIQCALVGAVTAGQSECVGVLLEWAPSLADLALALAAQSARRDCMFAARERGATNFGLAAELAAGAGEERVAAEPTTKEDAGLCKSLAREWADEQKARPDLG